MKRCLIKASLLVCFILMICSAIVFAADAEYRFTHNDHDTLLIGEITSIENNKMQIRAIDYIVSSTDLNVNDKKEQLRPEKVTIPITSAFGMDTFMVGDYVIASLDENGDEFIIAWGIFKVDSTDFKTLKVAVDYSPEISALYTDFVNSGGVYSESAFEYTNIEGAENNEEIVNYQEQEDAEEQVFEHEQTAAIELNELTHDNENKVTSKHTNITSIYTPYIVCGVAIIVMLIICLLKKHKVK